MDERLSTWLRRGAIVSLPKKLKQKTAARAGTIRAGIRRHIAYANARFMVAVHIGAPGVVVRGMPWPSAVRFGSPSM